MFPQHYPLIIPQNPRRNHCAPKGLSTERKTGAPNTSAFDCDVTIGILLSPVKSTPILCRRIVLNLSLSAEGASGPSVSKQKYTSRIAVQHGAIIDPIGKTAQSEALRHSPALGGGSRAMPSPLSCPLLLRVERATGIFIPSLCWIRSSSSGMPQHGIHMRITRRPDG